jgi:hypothetical protein
MSHKKVLKPVKKRELVNYLMAGMGWETDRRAAAAPVDVLLPQSDGSSAGTAPTRA